MRKLIQCLQQLSKFRIRPKLQGGQKSEPLPNDQKIVLKLVDEIRFIRQIKAL